MGLILSTVACPAVDCVWKVMAHAQKPDFVFRRNGRVHLNRRGRQFSRLLAAEVWKSAVVMLDTQCSEVVWRSLATHSIRQFPLHFPSRASVYHHISTGLYHTFSTLSHKHDFRERLIKNKMCVLILSVTFVRNISHCKNNSARYCQKWTHVYLCTAHHNIKSSSLCPHSTFVRFLATVSPYTAFADWSF